MSDDTHPPDVAAAPGAHGVLSGGGEMGALMRSIDWSNTAVGAVQTWPQSLRTSLSILLETGFPMYIAWGPSFTQFYNDGYRPILGSTKHPAAMGISTRETFAEIWHIIGPMFDGVMRGTPVSLQDFHLPLDRHGFVEECYFIVSYSPIREESGNVGGVLVTVTETTLRVLGTRRLATLQDLAAKMHDATTMPGACKIAVEVLQLNSADVPFAAVYAASEQRASAAPLVADSGFSAIASSAPRHDPTRGDAAFGIARVFATKRARIIDWPSDVALGGHTALAGPPMRAFASPIFTPGTLQPRAVIVTAISPSLKFDVAYQSFLELVAGHLGSAIARAEALEQAQSRAEALAEIDRAKTLFFSNISHELRTPLTLILGPCEDALSADGQLTEVEAQRWSLVQRSARRLSKLVNTLLDFSRIEAGRVQATYQPTDLPGFTAELASMFRSAIERAGLTLSLDLPPLDQPAYVDREMWEKIVLNLLSNALKFTFAGAIFVSLRIDEGAFELSVRDTGTGIPAAELLKVFDRFHRVKGARARTHEGTGIGLALVAELAKLHGGAARVESTEGRGTTVTVRVPAGSRHLPADRTGIASTAPTTSTARALYVEEASQWMEAMAPLPQSSTSAELAAATATSGRARARIVLADDNADMREYLGRLLRERWDVEACGDGETALAAIRRHRPNLVLSDVMMPRLDGVRLLRAIREDPELSLTPVILLSARAGEEATADGLGAGATDYIVKPFSARELLVRVAAALASAGAVREARAVEEAARVRLYGHFMQAPFPVAALRGPDHVIELANPMILNAWGKHESVVGKLLIDALPELRGQPFLGYLDDVLRTGVAHRGRAELARLVRSREDGAEDAYFDFVYAPLRDATGVVEGILIAAFEVTSQVRAAQELSRLLANAEADARQFTEVVENLPELAWTARADGYIDYYNQRWYEYTGTTFEEMAGWGWKAVHDPARVEEVSASWQRSVETGEPFEMEFQLRGADGKLRWFLTRVRPVRDDEGRIVRWFGSNTNIDERRKNDDFKEMFLGIVGHDLRNPLHTILFTSRHLASRADMSEENRKMLQRVASSGARMKRMIEQLLDVTRARLAGGIPVELSTRPVALAPLVGKIVDEIRGGYAGLHVEMNIDPECSARVDEDRFEQVVSNLLGNAATHGEPGRPIDVTLASGDGWVSVAIHNDGKPIAPEFLPLLWNPFARNDKPHGRSAGLGLGLYICERIIDAHRGQLSVQSSAEAGTRFEIRLPKDTTTPAL